MQTPTSISLAVVPASNGQKGSAAGKLVDSNGAGIATAQVQLTVRPLDGPGVDADYTLSGVVPALATKGIVGLRVNTECNCAGSSNFILYQARYGERGAGNNLVPNSDFANGLEGWGISGNASAGLEPRENGVGFGLHVISAPTQSAIVNSSPFTVTPGATYTTTFSARVGPASVGSGYFTVIFNLGPSESQREYLNLQPGTVVSRVNTGPDGTFSFNLGGLPASRLLLEASFAGDPMHAPATNSLTYAPTPTALAVLPASVILSAGESQQLSTSVADQLGNAITGLSPSWSVSPESLGAIDSAGLFTAGPGAGNGTITAQAGGLSSSAPVAVTASNTLPSGTPVVVNAPRPQTGVVLSFQDFLAGSGGSAYQAMVKALEACKRLSAAKLTIAPGRYVFDDPDLAATPYLPAIILYQLSDLTIDGQGAEFVFHFPDHSGISVLESHRVIIRGLVLDWDIPFGVPGVAHKEPDGRTSVRFLDGYPFDPSTPIFGVGAFDLDRFIWKYNDGDYGFPKPTVLPLIGPQTISDPSFTIFKEGASVVARIWGVPAVAVNIASGSSDITLDRVTVYASPSAGIVVDGGADRGFRIANCTIKRRPQTNRVISTVGPGVLIYQIHGDVVLEDSEISGCGDDGVNPSAGWFELDRRVDSRTLILRCQVGYDNFGKAWMLAAGDDLKINSKTDFHEIMRCRVSSVTFDPGSLLFTATLDSDTPSTLVPGDLVGTLTRASARFIARRNFIHNNRAHGIILESPDALIEDNDIRDVPLPGIQLDADGYFWMIGTGCEDVVVRGNRLEDCGSEFDTEGLGAISVTGRLRGATGGMVVPDFRIHRRIVLEDNRVARTPKLALFVSSCDGVTAEANSIIDSNLAPFDGRGASLGLKARGSFMVTRTSNMSLRDTHQSATGPTFDNGVYVDPLTVTSVTVQNNVDDTHVSVIVPVVLDAFGKPPSHYTSDLVLANRSASTTRASLTYQPAPGTPGAAGSAILATIAAGLEWRVPDVIELLRNNGQPIPASGPGIVGSLAVDFLDVKDPALVYAASRTSTPNFGVGGGSFGLFVPAAEALRATYRTATITGLREDESSRSNLALVDIPTGSGPAEVSIQIYDGDLGLPAGDPIGYALQAGDWKQFNSILSLRSVRNGWVTVTRTGGGTNRFQVYGVVNDGGSAGGGTSDGSYITPGASPGLLPIVLRLTSGSVRFSSELILTNTSGSTADTLLSYTPADAIAPGSMVTATVSLLPGRQIRIPDVIAYLQDLGLSLPPGDRQGGTLQVEGASALVRTSNPNPDRATGGTFGLAYPASPSARRAKTEGWVYGLSQDAMSRSNLAIADARVGDSSVVDYVVEVWDSDNGRGKPALVIGPIPLSGGQWYQVSSILVQAGVAHGYVRVYPASGTSDFIVYGVINDGGAPGLGTSDGSFVPMVVTHP